MPDSPIVVDIILGEDQPAVASLFVPGPAGPPGPKGDPGTGAGGGDVASVNGLTGEVVLNANSVGALAVSVKGAANGVASLDASGKVPTSQLPNSTNVVTSVNNKSGAVTLTASDVSALATSEKGAANGVAALDGAGKVPSAQLPAQTITSVNSMTGAVVLAATDVGAIATTQKGVANGVAALDGSGKVPSSQLPASSNSVNSVNSQTGVVVLTASDIGAIAATAKGAANGVASLDSTGKVPSSQVPAAPVTSVNSKTGSVVLTAADVNADPAGSVSSHVAATDPHGDRAFASTLVTSYQPLSARGVANGYASLDGTGKVPASQLPATGVSSVNTLTGAVVLDATSLTGSKINFIWTGTDYAPTTLKGNTTRPKEFTGPTDPSTVAGVILANYDVWNNTSAA